MKLKNFLEGAKRRIGVLAVDIGCFAVLNAIFYIVASLFDGTMKNDDVYFWINAAVLLAITVLIRYATGVY